MAEAAAVLIEHGISGAPVLDDQGHCVGVLSASDFVQRERAQLGMSSSLSACEKVVVRDSPSGSWRIEDVYQDRVAVHMSPAVQTVNAHAPLVEAGRMMCVQRIHRLPVLDASGHAMGILTALDVVAALVRTVDEASGRTTHFPQRGLATAATTQNRKRAAELQRQHATLHSQLDSVRTAITTESDQNRVAAMLEGLVRRAEDHFRSEETGGYFDEAVAHAPRLADRAAHLLLQHPVLLGLLRELVDMARKPVPRNVISVHFESVAADWLAHEAEESHFLLEAYTQDIGTKD
jgi:CBS domain-containing protein